MLDRINIPLIMMEWVNVQKPTQEPLSFDPFSLLDMTRRSTQTRVECIRHEIIVFGQVKIFFGSRRTTARILMP